MLLPSLTRIPPSNNRFLLFLFGCNLRLSHGVADICSPALYEGSQLAFVQMLSLLLYVWVDHAWYNDKFEFVALSSCRDGYA